MLFKMYVKIIFIKIINNDRFQYNIKLQHSVRFWPYFFDNVTFKYPALCFNFLDDNHNSCLFLTYTGVKRNAAQNIIQ